MEADGRGGRFNFTVDDPDALWEQLHGKVTVIEPLFDTAYGTRKFTIADPDGNELGFAPAGAGRRSPRPWQWSAPSHPPVQQGGEVEDLPRRGGEGDAVELEVEVAGDERRHLGRPRGGVASVRGHA